MDEALTLRATALKKKASLIGHGVIGFLVINLICLGLIGAMFSSLQAMLAMAPAQALISQVHDKELQFKDIDSQTRINRNELNTLEGSVDHKTSERDIIEMTDLIIGNEQDIQLFYRLLKVNIYLLTSQINGSLSWFEIYGHEIDRAILRSQSRQLQALHVRRFYGQVN